MINFRELLPKNWKYKEGGNKIKIWYENKRKNPGHVILNSKIKVSRELGSLFGFWVGDGSKRTFALTNGNFDLMKDLLNYLMDLGISQEELKIRVKIPNNFSKKEVESKVKSTFSDIQDIKFKGWDVDRNYPSIKIKFLEGYNNLNQDQYSKEEVEFLILKNMQSPNKVSSISNLIKRNRQTVREHILLKENSLYKRGLINIHTKGIGSSPDLWMLTLKGDKLLNKKMKKIEEASKAIAEAVKMCKPDVVPMYPITPQLT